MMRDHLPSMNGTELSGSNRVEKQHRKWRLYPRSGEAIRGVQAVALHRQVSYTEAHRYPRLWYYWPHVGYVT